MKKKMKVIIISILFMGLLTLNSIAIGFSDVSDNQWFYNSVTKMTEQGIFKGYPDGTFKPDNTVTYGEFIKMFVVAVTGEDVGNNTTGQGHWAKNYYDKGIELGLYTEYDIPEYRLEDGIARKYMALLISNNFKDIEIENYNLIKDRISDLESGRPYQHQIIKAYGLGIITGYPGGEFKPNGTLTRAESATVISRLLNEDERQVPKFEVSIADDSYWKNDANYEEMVEWYNKVGEEPSFLNSGYRIEKGKIIIADPGFEEWIIEDTDYPGIHKDIYTVLKAYYDYAKDTEMGVSIIGTTGTTGIEGTGTIRIKFKEKKLSTQELFSFTFSAQPRDLSHEDKPGYVLPYILYTHGRYFTHEDIEEYGTDFVLDNDRIGDGRLVELNRDIFKELYGETTGNQLMDYVLTKYKAVFDKENRKKLYLEDEQATVDGINVYYWELNGASQINFDQPK